MPRGGGGFSGGSRGGFSGGGSRGFSGGSSFRSSSFSRSSSSRGRSSFSSRSSSSRPFGRTGSSRTHSSSSRRGPYSHTRYHPHRSYYRHSYYRPWYRRRYWWYGHYYRPWYYTPAYWLSGTVVLIVLMLIMLPMIDIAIAYPFSNTSSTGDINYRSTETLYFNEYWYEYEYLEAGSTITYSAGSSSAPISFAIADHSFSDFPTTEIIGEETYQISLAYNDFSYTQLFAGSGSTIDYSFSADGAMDFMILDGVEFDNWYNYDTYFAPVEYLNTLGNSGSLSIEGGNIDIYIVAYNPNPGTTINVDMDIDYILDGVPDLSAALVYNEGVYSTEGTYTVPSDGTYYFFVYFDPLLSPDSATDITFDVTFHTNVESSGQWLEARSTLIWILIIAGVVLIFAVRARKQQKTNKDADAAKKAATSTATQPAKTVSSSTKTTRAPSSSTTSSYGAKLDKCTRCSASLEPGAKFCPKCGKKKEGRTFGSVAPATNAQKRKYCNFCGNPIPSEGGFCERCGTAIQR
ncbi:MAG: zinc ribbon domain-containing protein [Promethearchaeota archaeon]